MSSDLFQDDNVIILSLYKYNMIYMYRDNTYLKLDIEIYIIVKHT